ncbi:hypothetical protein D3C80_2051510 [compost metagenome]
MHPRIDRHLQVVRSVAHHHHTVRLHVQFLHQLMQHGGVRLAEGFIGRAGGVKQGPQTGCGQRAGQAHPAFAGSHGQAHVLAGQFGQQLRDAIKQA